MHSLYRYISGKYVESFARKGELLFRSLSYYRDFEDTQVRGDEFEGTRIYKPHDGLLINNLSTNQQFHMLHAFESSVHEDDIFICCLSNLLSRDLATKFNCDYCIEILKPYRFKAKLCESILPKAEVEEKLLVFDSVRYYSPEEPPLADWALPEKIALCKPKEFEWQHETRVAFAINGAFRIENVNVQLVPPGDRRKPPSIKHQSRMIKLGCISSFCKIWHVNDIP